MYNLILLVSVSFFSAMLTFFVNEELKQGPVRSSAILSLLVGGYFYFFPGSMDPYLVKTVPIVFIGASFVGMVSARLLSNYLLIGIGGIIFCMIYLHTSTFFNGYGGALGTSASIALLAVLSMPIIGKNRKLTNGLVQLRAVLFKPGRKS
jgi:hypothetical protein